MPILPPRDIHLMIIGFAIITGIVVLIDVVLGFSWLITMDTPRPLFAPKWSVVHAWFGLQAMMVITLMLTFPIVELIAGVPSDNPVRFAWAAVATLPIQAAVFCGVVVFFVRIVYGERMRDIGLRIRPHDWEILYGIGAGLAGLVIIGAVQVLTNVTIIGIWGLQALKHLKIIQNPLYVGTLLKPLESGVGLVALVVAGAVIAPFSEEMVFRGFLLNALKKRFNPATAIIVSGIVFAAFHLPLLYIPAYVAMGIYMGYVYHKTGSLWVTFFLHLTNNALAFLVK
ncbi:MAG: CPBP family intramembrane metalloprotease [Armatimonadetes bacterium]|nr:CPBP family intramembrane metalloprotease [Armatimonadota bacterium]